MKTKNVNVKFFGRFLNSVFEKESKKVTNKGKAENLFLKHSLNANRYP